MELQPDRADNKSIGPVRLANIKNGRQNTTHTETTYDAITTLYVQQYRFYGIA